MVYPCNLKLILYPMCWQFPEMDFTGASWNSMRNVAEHWQLTQRIDWPRDIASCDSCSAVAHFSTLFPHFWFRKILQIPSGVPTTDAAVQRSRVLSLEGPQRQPLPGQPLLFTSLLRFFKRHTVAVFVVSGYIYSIGILPLLVSTNI